MAQRIVLTAAQVRGIARDVSNTLTHQVEHANGWPIKDPERFARMRADLYSTVCEALVDAVDEVKGVEDTDCFRGRVERGRRSAESRETTDLDRLLGE